MIRGLIRGFLHTIVYPNFFIALCAAAMAWETGQMLKAPVSVKMLGALFFSTLLAYSFHGLINLEYPSRSARHNWNQRHRWFLAVQSGLAILLLFFVILPGVRYFWLWLLGGIATFFYSAPHLPGSLGKWFRKIAFGKTFYLALMWTFATSYLPVADQFAGAFPMAGVFIGYRFFLIYAICMLFDLRDLKEDQLRGVRSLPALVGMKKVRMFLLLSLAGATGFYLWIQLLLGVSATWPLGLPILLLIPLSGYAQHNRSDFLFFVLLDGLMAFSAAVHAVIKWLTLYKP